MTAPALFVTLTDKQKRVLINVFDVSYVREIPDARGKMFIRIVFKEDHGLDMGLTLEDFFHAVDAAKDASQSSTP